MSKRYKTHKKSDEKNYTIVVASNEYIQET